MPPSITSGSIVDITVAQNSAAEQKSAAAFESLQSQILNSYGLHSPATPELRLRNVTQTSIVLEWDPIDLQTTTLRSLALYRNGQKAGNIPKPFDMHSTKISGLQLEAEYSFYLVLRTSGGTFTSNNLVVKTHSMANLTGITITPGVLPPQLRESLEAAVERTGAKLVDTVRIDTTHFVCTEGRGKDWEKANENNIPIVRPEWLEGCEREGKLIGVRGYYLDANPKHRQIGSNPQLDKVQSPPLGDPRQGLSMASPTSQAAMAASQAELPKISEKTEEEEDKESEVEGEPGPEVMGTPTLDNGAVHAREEEVDEDEESEDEVPPDPEKPRVDDEVYGEESEEDEDDEEGEPTTKSKGKEKAEGGGEMEDVAL